tara:strand:- start:815 stop:1054 length:240 start_codon:yes stop_codon:yes gene_type:complete
MSRARNRVNSLKEFVENIIVEAQILALRSRDGRLQDIVNTIATEENIDKLVEFVRSEAEEAGVDNAFISNLVKQAPDDS